MIQMDPAKCGDGRADYCRANVYVDYWDRLVKVLESVGGVSSDVTRRQLQLGGRDHTTGWYDKNWIEHTITSHLVPRSSSRIAVTAGTYVRQDALLFAVDPVKECDEIEDAFGKFWQVSAVREISHGDSFAYRECDLSYLPLHSLSYSDTEPVVSDARKNTRNYWTAYLDSDNLNNHSYITCYSNPDYPMVRVFEDKEIDIIFAVDQPTSTPLPGHDRKPYGYEEYVPTDVLALDTQLMHLGGAELRRITEVHPEGSQRSLESMTPNTTRLGSHTLYSQRHILNYRRDLT